MLDTRTQFQATLTQLVDSNTAGAVQALAVVVDEAEVRISGTTATYYVKQLATQAALAACDGRAVRNDIHVKSH